MAQLCERCGRYEPLFHSCTPPDSTEAKAKEYIDLANRCSERAATGIETAKAYRIQAEAVGGTKAEALAYLLRIVASLTEDPHERGHTCGGTGGNASARIESIL